MWLINTKTYRLEEFHDEIPPYAILSHFWEKDEITFQDIQSWTLTRKLGWKKVKSTCKQAVEHGMSYLWVDTCCIDKSSSAELSEAINSMYRWYQGAEVCYVYLSDFSLPRSFVGPTSSSLDARSFESLSDCTDVAKFVNSRWFTRGWTLQELIAPSRVMFFTRDWTLFGTKKELAYFISKQTRIDMSVLISNATHADLSAFTIAERMSWAMGRNTSRLEDKAYSLLGIFDIQMPLLYGEGAKAFVRLQEEIMKTSVDHSIFAWHWDNSDDPLAQDSGLLAREPSVYLHDGLRLDHFALSHYQMTNRGLEIDLLVSYLTPPLDTWQEALGLLNCIQIDEEGNSGRLAIPLQIDAGSRLAFVRQPTSVTRRCYAVPDTFDAKRMRLTISNIPQLSKHFPSILTTPLSFDYSFYVQFSFPVHAVIDAFPQQSFRKLTQQTIWALEQPCKRGAIIFQKPQIFVQKEYLVLTVDINEEDLGYTAPIIRVTTISKSSIHEQEKLWYLSIPAQDTVDAAQGSIQPIIMHCEEYEPPEERHDHVVTSAESIIQLSLGYTYNFRGVLFTLVMVNDFKDLDEAPVFRVKVDYPSQ